MAVEIINGARIHYDVFGKGEPVVLIHGFGGTGRSHFESLIPPWVSEFRLIVPDMRGHGQSDDPAGTYSFAQMASDVAGLIHRLGFRRACVVGYSNGGNVALYLARYHAPLVRGVVAYAANAYVDDGVRRAMSKLMPEEIERNDPAWAQRMARLHGEPRWRTLCRAACEETVTHPHWRKEELSSLGGPLLAVQGELDEFNAAGRHAEFIAEGVPGAELWIVPGVGHAVHEAVPGQFRARVGAFLEKCLRKDGRLRGVPS